MRENISSNSLYEPVVGFSRAVRVGNQVFVSGTVAWGIDGKIVSADVYSQAKQCIANIATALEKAGASLSSVVRTRIYVTDMAFANDVARAHHEAFDAIRPASTLVQVAALASSEMLVEFEADAVVIDTA